MPSDLSVSAAKPPNLVGGSAVAKEPLPAEAAAGEAWQARPNPSLRLDPALGLVVIEFRDSQGGVTSSIPTERQLQDYRRLQDTGKHRPEVLPGMNLPRGT